MLGVHAARLTPACAAVRTALAGDPSPPQKATEWKSSATATGGLAISTAAAGMHKNGTTNLAMFRMMLSLCELAVSGRGLITRRGVITAWARPISVCGGDICDRKPLAPTPRPGITASPGVHFKAYADLGWWDRLLAVFLLHRGVGCVIRPAPRVNPYLAILPLRPLPLKAVLRGNCTGSLPRAGGRVPSCATPFSNAPTRCGAEVPCVGGCAGSGLGAGS